MLPDTNINPSIYLSIIIITYPLKRQLALLHLYSKCEL